MSQIFALFGGAVSIIVKTVGVITIVYSIYKYLHRAKFAVTFIPKDKKQLDQYIKHSGLDELRIHKRRSFQEIKTESRMHSKTVENKKIHISARNEKCEIPLIIQNIGNKEAGNVKLVVRFDEPHVQIVDLHVETFKVEHYYNSQPNEILSETLAERNMDRKILEYYDCIEMTGAYLSLETTFSGGAFELVVLGISIPREIKSFLCLLRIECPNVLYKRQLLVQKFNVKHG